MVSSYFLLLVLMGYIFYLYYWKSPKYYRTFFSSSSYSIVSVQRPITRELPSKNLLKKWPVRSLIKTMVFISPPAATEFGKSTTIILMEAFFKWREKLILHEIIILKNWTHFNQCYFLFIYLSCYDNVKLNQQLRLILKKQR